jgi:hypothetical protein
MNAAEDPAPETLPAEGFTASRNIKEAIKILFS